MRRFSEKSKRAFTLVELILTVSMVAVIGTATIGIVRSSHEDWQLTSSRSAVLQDGRAAVVRMIRELRQTKGIRSVSAPGDDAGSITFESIDGQENEFRLNTETDEIEFGLVGSLSGLIGAVSRLVFTCYDADLNLLADPVSVGNIRLIRIEGNFADENEEAVSFTLSDQVFLPTDSQPKVVINEMMYTSPGNLERRYEWVELYNGSDTAVDITGWTIWTSSEQHADALTAYLLSCIDSAIIAADGYAIITVEDTDIYNELIDNGRFETGNLNDWEMQGAWSKTKWNAQEGNWKLERSEMGVGKLWQEVQVPTDLRSCLFIFWEMTTASQENTNITVEVRGDNDDVLMQGFSGQMSSDWTCHLIDLAALAGGEVTIHFEVNKTVSGGVILLDTISVASSLVDASAVRLSSGDNNIGDGLGNNNETITVTNGTSIIDTVVYNNSWGGDGDGTSLARIDQNGDSNSSGNWESGPVDGTPGWANN